MDIKDIIQEGRAIRNLSVKADIQSAYHTWCRNVRSFLKENSINEQLQNEAAVCHPPAAVPLHTSGSKQ